MFTVSRFVKSSLLVLLAATLAATAYAREGGGGHNSSNVPSGPSMQVHGSPVLSNARIDSGNGGPIWSKDPVAHGYNGQPGKTTPVVRDHRAYAFPGQPISNSEVICSNGCVPEGGGDGRQPTPQPNSYKSRDGNVIDHRTGSGPVVHDHRSSGPVVTIKFP
jgi:hypothetical protein